MIFTLIFWPIYGIGYLFTLYRIVGQMAWGAKGSFRDVPAGDDWVFSMFGGLIGAGIWPITLPISFAVDADLHKRHIFYIPPAHKEQMQRRLIFEQHKRIQELERECGVE